MVMALFSVVFVLGLAFGSTKKDQRILEPSVALPTTIKVRTLLTTSQYTEPVPWLSTVIRSELTCKREKICDQNKAYTVTLPNTHENTWYLKTADMFVTDYFTKYPFATVVIVPKGPKDRRFIIDNSYIGYGLVPSVNENNTLAFVNQKGEGLDVTGDFPHSFVIKNEADHDILFAREAFDGPIPAGLYIEYWTLKPGSMTLMWPAQRYWSSKLSGIKRFWNASALPSTTDNDFAAYLAETMMYDFLAPQAPIG